MANNDETGISAALDLAKAAADLQKPSFGARGAEDGGDQDELFGDSADKFDGMGLFGDLVAGDEPKKAGRPKGARNRRTVDIVRLIESTGRNPLLGMAEIIGMPIKALALKLETSIFNAAQFQQQVRRDLAPYTAQKQPTAIVSVTANAGLITVIDTNAHGQIDGGNGMNLQLVDGEGEIVENQTLSDNESAKSHE